MSAITSLFDEQPAFVAWGTRGVYLQWRATHRVTLVRGQSGHRHRDARDRARQWHVFRFLAQRRPDYGRIRSRYTDGAARRSRSRHWRSFAPRVVTTSSAQVRDWKLGTREVVRWKSRDGAEIEGILIKPRDFDPSRKYPLLCIIHGGPTGIDRPTLPDARYYPVDEWVNRGALVLKVNYRGSAGYGERFRALNYRNLGVGDAWDVISGVDALVAKGVRRSGPVASMGWSQGGYISAFLTTSSTRFVATRVGAGISDWRTYYYNTDITPFTVNYLGADPVADPAIYAKTSPIDYVRAARTPTLIQHGELDRRVPIANGYQLRQALEDRGVPVEMIVYKGFGTGSQSRSRSAR